jgi:porphobilinogen synthase
MGFPTHRPRRLRKNENLRRMVRETSLSVNDLIYPMFVVHGENIKKEIPAIPENYHLSVDRLVEDVKEVRDLGIPAVLFFGLPEKQDEMASEAYSPDGIVPKAIKAVKENVPDILVIADVCLCGYMDHGHCGVIKNGYVDNDATLELVSKITLNFAQAGADMVAPSCMMDGQIKTMRETLDKNGYETTAIMSYASKFASKLYDPFFKHGSQSVVSFGDKKSYQMDFANPEEAMREIALDIEEGADIVMVKPGMFYLDVVYRAKQEFGMPLAVYNVSGEYTMIKSAAELGRIDEQSIMLEVMMGFKRAGADLILTYFSKSIAKILNNSR